VPPAPRRLSKREKTLAGVRVATDLSSHSRHAMTSMPPMPAARQSSGAARASSGEPFITPLSPLEPRASTQPSRSLSVVVSARLR
jgi:hypothetical protein